MEPVSASESRASATRFLRLSREGGVDSRVGGGVRDGGVHHGQWDESGAWIALRQVAPRERVVQKDAGMGGGEVGGGERGG